MGTIGVVESRRVLVCVASFLRFDVGLGVGAVTGQGPPSSVSVNWRRHLQTAENPPVSNPCAGRAHVNR